MSGKYRNRKTAVNGVTFDSAGEARRYQDLAFMERGGLITDLRCQVPFELAPAFKDRDGKRHRPITYIADFVYDEDGVTVVEDFKGVETDVFKLKRKLFLARYPQYKFRISR